MMILVLQAVATAIIDYSQGPQAIISFTFDDNTIVCTDFVTEANCLTINGTLRYYPKGLNGAIIDPNIIDYNTFFTPASGKTATIVQEQLLITVVPFITSSIANFPQGYVCNQPLNNVQFQILGVPLQNIIIQSQPQYNQVILTTGTDFLGTIYDGKSLNFTIGDIVYNTQTLLQCTDCVNNVSVSGTRVVFGNLDQNSIQLQELILGQSDFQTIASPVSASLQTGGEFAFFSFILPTLSQNSFLRLKIMYQDVCYSSGVVNTFYQILDFKIAQQFGITYNQIDDRHESLIGDVDVQNCLKTVGNQLDLVTPAVDYSIAGYVFDSITNILTFNLGPSLFYKIKVQNYTQINFEYQCTGLEKLIVFVDRTNSIFQVQPGVNQACGSVIASFPYQFVNVPKICQTLVGPQIIQPNVNLTWDSCLNFNQTIETLYSPYLLSFSMNSTLPNSGIPLPTTQKITVTLTYSNITVQTLQLFKDASNKVLCQQLSLSLNQMSYLCDLSQAKVGIYDLQATFTTQCNDVITQQLTQISFTLNMILDLILTTWVNSDRINNQVPSQVQINYIVTPLGAQLGVSVDNCYSFDGTTIKFLNTNVGLNPLPSTCIINIFYQGNQDQYSVQVLPQQNLFDIALCKFGNSEYDLHDLVQLVALSVYSVQCQDINNVPIPTELLSVNSQPAYAFQPKFNAQVQITYCQLLGQCDTKISPIVIIELVLPSTVDQFLALPNQQKRIVIQKFSELPRIQSNENIVNIIFSSFKNCTTTCFTNYFDIPITNYSTKLATIYNFNTSLSNLQVEENTNLITNWLQFYRITPQIITQQVRQYNINSQFYSLFEIQSIINSIPLGQNGFNLNQVFITQTENISVFNYFTPNVRLQYGFGQIQVLIYSSTQSNLITKYPISVDGSSLKLLISSKNYVYVEALSTVEVTFSLSQGQCVVINSPGEFSYTLLNSQTLKANCTQKLLANQIVCICKTQLQGSLIKIDPVVTTNKFTAAEIFGISLGAILLASIVVSTIVIVALKLTGKI